MVGTMMLLFFFGDTANAVWMLASHRGWFQGVPAGVPDFGPLNEHFVRDLGSMFLVFGGLMLIGAFRMGVRRPALWTNFAWYSVHALVHVYDTLRGLVEHSHFLTDLPLVYAPIIFLLVAIFLDRRVPVTP